MTCLGTSQFLDGLAGQSIHEDLQSRRNTNTTMTMQDNERFVHEDVHNKLQRDELKTVQNAIVVILQLILGLDFLGYSNAEVACRIFGKAMMPQLSDCL